jgi:GDP-L-fucose synthase
VENVDMGRNVLLASHNAGIKKIINLSSSCMYPRNAKNPLTEDLILTGGLEPTNEGYALAKILTLRLGEYINKENEQFNCKTLIPCNLYGRFDKFDPDRSHLIPAIIHKIHQAKINHVGTVEIWGDGSARREFMYAGDLADAVIRSLITFDEVPSIMNLGLGYDFTINEYYESVASVVGWHGRFIHDLSRPVGMQQKLVSTALQEKWGWTPSTSIRDGIQNTYDFYLKNLQ